MKVPSTLPGKVYLTGAGPGSAKMLTLRAMEVLRTAEVVFHDDLVSDEVLALIPSRTAVYNVGKRCGVKKTTQEEINRRMISTARSGQSVVRLKGGDPLIFGRTDEEIRALREAKIPFEIIPGITAATAAAAAAEIPLTDRALGSKLLIASNHTCSENSSREWRKTVSTDTTLVFYMPGGDFGPVQEELASSGLKEDTPCLLVSQAARPGQRLLRTTLQFLTSLPALPAPSVLIVGAVVAGAKASDWMQFENVGEASMSVRREESSIALSDPERLSLR